VCDVWFVQDYAHSPAYPVLLISYEMFVRYAELLKAVQFDLIVCDEGHRLKNNSIKTSTVNIVFIVRQSDTGLLVALRDKFFLLWVICVRYLADNWQPANSKANIANGDSSAE
jgi:hypothetical protein